MLTAPVSLHDTLRARGLTTLLQAFEAAGLTNLLEEPGPLTLFAPSNDAFSALPAGELARLLDPANVAELGALLQYHVVDGTFPAATLEGLTSVMTRQAADIRIDTPGGVLFVNDARVVAPDVEAINGVLHGVDSVLYPPVEVLSTLAIRGHSILVELLGLAGLNGTLNGGNLTLLAPTDAAWGALAAGRLDQLRDPANIAELTDLLQFHLIPGQVSALTLLVDGDTPNLQGDLIFGCVHNFQLQLNDSPSSHFNVPATGGLLHTLDQVLTPTRPLRVELDGASFTILAGLIDQAGLTSLLQDPGARTLFGPTDSAFNALPTGELTALQAPANVALREDFLMRHLLDDALQQTEIGRRNDLVMANGTIYTIAAGTTLTVGGVPLLPHGVFASNGILHVVETVLP